MRKVALGSTFYFGVPARSFSTGIPNALAGTPDLAAVEMDGTNAVIDTGITVAAHGSLTAWNLGTCIATTANGYEYGKVYAVVIDAGTSDTVSVVGEQVYEFQIETASEEAARLAQESFLLAASPTDFTGNTTSALNLTGLVDSSAAASDVVGELFGVRYNGGTFDGLAIIIRSTAYAVTNQLATVEQLDGGALPEAVASGDYVFRLGADPKWAADQALVDFDPPTKTDLDVLGTEALATQASVNTVDANVDAILLDTGTDGVVVAVASKTGYSLSAAGIQAVWDALTSALTTAGSIGKAIVDLAARIVGTLATGTHQPQTGDSFARIGATGSGLTSLAQASVATEARLAELDAANLPADLDAVLTDTGTTLPATLATIAGYIDTEIGTLQTSVDDLPTNAELTTALGTLNDLSAAAVNAEVDTAIADAFGIVTGSVNDAAAAVTGFTVTDDAGADIRLGTLRLTSGALAGESRLVTWTGTTVAVVQPTSVPAGLTTVGPFSAAPANGVTYTFRPL